MVKSLASSAFPFPRSVYGLNLTWCSRQLINVSLVPGDLPARQQLLLRLKKATAGLIVRYLRPKRKSEQFLKLSWRRFISCAPPIKLTVSHILTSLGAKWIHLFTVFVLTFITDRRFSLIDIYFPRCKNQIHDTILKNHQSPDCPECLDPRAWPDYALGSVLK